jgi:hypothetical protein
MKIPNRAQIPKTVALGELILAVFDKAAEYSADPREVSRLATQTISHMLWQMPTVKTSPRQLGTVS